MATLNELQCLTTAGNTGYGACYFDPKEIIGAFHCPKGFEFDVTDPQTTLIAATHNASKAARIYPIYGFLTPKDSSEKRTVQTFNNGSRKTVREGYNNWEFQYVDGGLTLLTELRKFNGAAWDFLFVDAENRIIGIQGSTATKIKAVPSLGGEFWAEPWMMADGSKVTEYTLNYIFNSLYLNDRVAFVKTSFDIQSTIYGLQDVILTAVTAGTSGSYKITPKTKIGTSLADLYPTALASTALWTVKNHATSGTCTITTITTGTDANGNACFIFAMDTTDTDYSGATNIDFNLAVPATLQAAGIDGYESTGAVTIAKN